MLSLMAETAGRQGAGGWLRCVHALSCFSGLSQALPMGLVLQYVEIDRPNWRSQWQYEAPHRLYDTGILAVCIQGSQLPRGAFEAGHGLDPAYHAG